MGDTNTPIKVESLHATRTMAFYLLYSEDRQDNSVPIEDLAHTFKEGFNLIYSDTLFELEIAHGVLENQDKLDEYIKPLLQNWNFNRLGCCTKIILRMAIWELLYKKAIPQVVIDEAIELAKDFAEKDAYKFINGLLDKIYKKYL
jgi:transcription antitermination protein NusB